MLLFYTSSAVAAIMLAVPLFVRAAETFRAPVLATVVEVLDGETFVAEALIWPGHVVRVNVRIRGIDAPEMKARCAAEHQAARSARAALAGLIARDAVLITNIAGAKYYGRVLADVTTAQGLGVAAVMLGAGLVRSYGGGKRDSWCD